jgi:hypothetical protein
MQGGDNRHYQLAQQRKYVASCVPVVDTIFMLQADKIVTVEIQEIGARS